MNKKALIFGGTGQIGLYLSKFLISKNYKVFITTRLLKKKTKKNIRFLKLQKVKVLTLNCFTKKKINEIIKATKPNEIN